MRAWVAVSAFLLCACASAGGDRRLSDPQSSAAIDGLLTMAATDFRAQRAPQPVQFRNVRGGYLPKADGAKQHRVCGEFLTTADDSKGSWVQFATIETDPYEQWLGGSSLNFCEDPLMKWDRADLSARMLARLQSVR
jgi:hypothetical protein